MKYVHCYFIYIICNMYMNEVITEGKGKVWRLLEFTEVHGEFSLEISLTANILQSSAVFSHSEENKFHSLFLQKC